MIRKTLVAAAAAAGLLTFGAAGAQAQPPTPQWLPVFYFGPYCTQAGMAGEQSGGLQPGAWKCDTGWLMVQLPPQQG